MAELIEGSCEIPAGDIISSGRSKSMHLKMLRSKGAPITGTAENPLELDERYELTVEVMHKYTWTPK